MLISLIVAAAENDVIGGENTLLWKLPADLRRFRMLTKGHPVIMGRKTQESIGRALPDRRNIVISRKPGLAVAGCAVARSFADALALAEEDKPDEAFVIGGGEIYREALPFADRIYLTRVHAQYAGDTTFPALSDDWWEVRRESHPADAENPHAYTYILYERKS